MQDTTIYQDIAKRTEGDIYIGVVGPVRTGKSTFIKRFMDICVLPGIDNVYKKERATDELPQSAGGRTIMTTEPKFVPNEAVELTLDNAHCNVRLVDCVGYMVDSALGNMEEGMPRMVQTPWNSAPIPFDEAAELGTKKVINEHSTIGLVITTDGSITDISRDEYIQAEERVIGELKHINKPFVIVLNSTNPKSHETENLRDMMEEKYGVPVVPLSCADMDIDDVKGILGKILYEFPLCEIGINMPKWLETLSNNHHLKSQIFSIIVEILKEASKIREVAEKTSRLAGYDFIEEARLTDIDLGSGNMTINLTTPDGLFYEILSEITGFEIDGDDKLLSLLTELASAKKEYDKVAYALKEVEAKGYGIVSPTIDELSLEEPEIVKQGSRFGVRLRASAPSIHMIRADIETEVSPIVGSEKQSEELVNYLMSEFEVDPKKIWESNIFGKSLHDLVNEGLHNKLSRMPEDARFKLQETLQRIINEGSGGLICIIL